MSRRRRRRNGLIIKIVLTIAILLIALGFIIFGIRSVLSSGNKITDLNAYFGTGNDGTGLVINDQVIPGDSVIKSGDNIYVDYDEIRTKVNTKVYFDMNEQLLLYALPTEVVEESAGSDSFIVEGERAFISLDFVSQYTDMDYKVYEDPDRVVIRSNFEGVRTVEARKKTQVLLDPNKKSEALSDVEKGTDLYYLEEGDKFSRVATEDGFVGYVKNSHISDPVELAIDRAFTAPEYTSIQMDETVCLGWHQVTSLTANGSVSEVITGRSGMNVIAPTWFFAMDTAGNIKSLASSEYVETAHSKGISVWAVANDFDGGSFGGIYSAEETKALLSSTSSRRNLEKQIVNAAVAAGVDGINIDFEKVGEDCDPHYIQFIREMSVACRNNDLVLSVDTYVPSAWTYQYHREEQAQIVDYLIIMAYDEYGSWSEEIGPNSSVNYVADAIRDTLKVAPADKIVIGLPFYTKLWVEEPIAGTSSYNLSVQTVRMDEAEKLLGENNATPTLDEEVGEYFATFEKDGKRLSIWLENKYSLDQKLQLMKDNNIAGCAFWKLTQENTDIWVMIESYVN